MNFVINDNVDISKTQQAQKRISKNKFALHKGQHKESITYNSSFKNSHKNVENYSFRISSKDYVDF